MAGNLLDDQLEQVGNTPPDSFTRAIRESLAGEAAGVESQMRSSVQQAAETTPERRAESMRLSERTGIPSSVIERNFDSIVKRSKIAETPYSQMLRETPVLARTVAEHPDVAAVAADDMEQLGLLEWLVTAPQRAWKQGTSQVEFGSLRHESLFRDLTQAEQQRLAQLKDEMKAGGELGAGQSWFRKAVVGTASQLPNLFGATLAGARLGIPAAVTAGTAAAIAGQLGPQVALPEEIVTVPTMFGAGMTAGMMAGAADFTFKQESGMAFDEYMEVRDELGQTLDPDVARAAALATGTLNAGLEAAGLEVLLHSIPGAGALMKGVSRSAVKEALRVPTVRAALGQAIKSYAGTLTAETATEVAQRAVTILAGEIAKTSGKRAPVEGQLAPGNVNLYQQPRVQNADGTVSTVDSLSVNLEGKEVLLPTVTPDGRHFAGTPDQIQQQAIAEYQKTGRHLGTFATPAAADKYAQQLHQDYAAGLYDKSGFMRTPSEVASDLLSEGVGAVTGFALMVAPGPGMSLLLDARRARQAQQGALFFQALGEGAANSKTLQRQPAAVRQLIEEATKDGPIPTLYAPVDTWTNYWQSQHVDPAQMAAEVTGDPDAYETARRTGEDLAIPTSRYVTKLAATEHNAYFTQELRLGPEEMNARESAAFQQEIARQSQAGQEAQAGAAVSPVRAAVLEKLTAAGVESKTAESYADLVANYEQLGERAGLGPLYGQLYGLDVSREGLATGVQQPGTSAVAEPAPSAAQPSTPQGPASGVTAAAEQIPGLAALEASLGGASLETLNDVAGNVVNASGESAASVEALSRQAGMTARGERFVVYDRAGRRRLLVGPDAVDYTPRQGETYGVESVEAGFRPLEDKGGRAPTGPAAQPGAGTGQQPGRVSPEQRQAGQGGTVQRAGDESRVERRRLPSPGSYPVEAFARQSAEADAARLTPEVHRELVRMAEELAEFPFIDKTWTWLPPEDRKTGNAAGGAADITGGEAGAAVYDDIQKFAPLNKGAKGAPLAKAVGGSRGKVEVAIRKMLETGTIHNNLAEGAVRVAERRAADDYRYISRPLLPPGWGTIATDELIANLSAAVDAQLEPVDLLADPLLSETDISTLGDVDTSFDIREFDQGLFDDLEPVDPTADALTTTDVLPTGEQQPRLPGAGGVRDTNVATPQLEAPFALTSEVSTAKKGKQTTLFQGTASTFAAPAGTPDAAIRSLPEATVEGIADAREVPFPSVTDEQADALMQARDRNTLTRQTVRLDQLVATQRTFSEHVALEYLDLPGEVLPALEMNGTIYLAGGHHRAIAAWARGEQTIEVEVAPVQPARLQTTLNQTGPIAAEDVQAFVADVQHRYGADLKAFDVALTNQGDLRLQMIGVDRGAQRAGLGTQVVRELTRFADRHGLRITLTPAQRDPAWGTTSRSRLVAFYKRFGFVENTGRRKDFGISDAMYREPSIPSQAIPEPSRKPIRGPLGPANAAGERAFFIGWQPGFEDIPPVALYNVVGGELDKSTVSTQQLEARGIPIPQTPEKPTTFGQPVAPTVITDTPAFRSWFGDSQVVDESGDPLVLYHGTTGDFTSFERDRGNIESDFGAGFYFSNNPADVGENYAGEGPDLNNKIERLVEQLRDRVNDGDPEITARVEAWQDEHPTSAADPIEALAREDLSVAHGGLTMPVYLKLENPAILGGPNETVLTFEAAVDEEGDYTGDESGTLLDLVQALRDVEGAFHDGDVEPAIEQLLSGGVDGDLTLRDAIEILKKSEKLHYYTDDTGNNATGEVIRRALEEAGYDGIIDRTVDVKFGSQRRIGKSMAGMTPDTTHYIAFEPTQIKSAIGNVGTFDPNQANILRQERRGAIRFGPERQFEIALLERADLSTFLHETGHLFLEVFGDVADKLQALDPATLNDQQRQILADYGATLGRFNVNNRNEITVAHHEQWAREFEAYLMNGEAPSLELRQAFARFRAWLLGIYRSLRRLNVDLTPEVRNVFDRLVASDAAIERAKQAGRVDPMFLTAEAAGYSEAEFSLYRQTVTDASRQAREGLDAKLMSEVTREQQATWKAQRADIRAEVEAQAHQAPVYRALAAVQRGTNPDGSALVEGQDPQPLKLSRAILVQRFGEDRLKRLPRGVSARAGGLDPDTVASRFGFQSGDELLTAIAQAPPLRAAIEQETDRRMLEAHGSILLDGSLHEKAQAAIANESREQVVRAELRALWRLQRQVRPFVSLERQTAAQEARQAERERAYERRWLEAEAKLRIAIAEGHKQVEIDRLRDELRTLRATTRGGAATIRAALPPAAALRDAARERVARTKIRELRPQPFWAASRRAAQAAIDAAARQDFDAAITAKQQELLNLALYREASTVRDEVETRVARARELGRPSARARLGLAGQSYQDQVDGILDRYEFARVSQKALDRRASLRKWVAGLEGEGQAVDLPEELLEETRRVNWQELTVEELRGVTDGLNAIVHLAQLKNRLLKAADKRELDAVANTVADSIREHAQGERRQPARDRRPAEERRRVVADWFAGHRKLANVLREMDGFVDGGPAWDAIMRPLNDAGAAEADRNAAATERFGTLVETAFPGSDKRKLYTKEHIPAVGKSLSRMERICVALNWGNEGNRDRIRRAEGWNDDQVRAVLDTLSLRDMQFVQGVFDMLESYWPDIAAKQTRVYGIAPEQVAALPIVTQHGEFRGGYYPLKYDDRLSASAIGKLDLEAANLARQAAYAHATTKRGHTEARQETLKQPVRLDFGVMFEHVAQVIHDLTHHEALIDVGKILSHGAVQQAILDTKGDLVYKQMRGAIRDVAFGTIPARNGFERALNHVRAGATIAGLGWNLTTSILQLSGFTNSIVRIGGKWVGVGLGRMLRSPSTMSETVDWVREVSPFMASRGRTQMREIAEIRNAVGVNTGRFTGWIDDALQGVTGGIVTKQGIADSYFWTIQMMQSVVDVPTWLGAYEKAMAGNESHDRAVALADQAVLDSQGGGQIKDLSQVQRGGPMMRLWTNFYSYFNVLYNQTVDVTKQARFNEPGSIGRLAADYLLLYVIPCSLGFAVREALRPGDLDPDKVAWQLLMENVAYLSGTMLGLREIAGTLQGYYGYEGPAGARAFASLSRLGQQIQQGQADSAFWRALNDTAGVMFHYPSGQAWRTINGIAALSEGRTENPGAVIVGAPPAK